MPQIIRRAKDTLTAVEMCHGDELVFELADRTRRSIVLESTWARIVSTTLATPGVTEPGARTLYRFGARIMVDGEAHDLEREIPSQRSFYEPWEFAGMRLWLDAVDDVFAFLVETHAPCRTTVRASVSGPSHMQARFAVQDASLSICPEPLHPWCPLPDGGFRVEQCYRGEDTWLGPYDGASAHGGLDINHDPGTPLWAPIDLDDQFYFNSLEAGHNNNRWRGLRRWANGAEWILQTHHMTALTVPEHTPVKRGAQFASGAGVLSGAAHHSHFVFKIHDYGETVLLDPWILFWQMYRDRDRSA